MSTQVADPLIGSLVDSRYRIRSRVARGGMATVYTALDERLERIVALKIIHPGHVRDGAFLDRFTDEAKTVARLTHPNVVAVYDQGTHDGLPYLVMEYVRGRTLREILAERRRLAPAEALAVMEQVLAALGSAHHAGLVHRDVKPENVLVAESPAGGNLVDAVVKVADFGLARAVEASVEDPDAGQLMATVAYVAPELVAEGYADPRSDVYSAGVMLFEMLTGRVPYDGDRPVDVAWQHVDRDVPPPSKFVAALPLSLDELVATATRRDPHARPTDAGALLMRIQAAREGLAPGNAATQRMRPIAAPTVVVPQVPERPSWARLPNQPKPRPRRRRRRGRAGTLAGVPDLLREWHGRLVSTQQGRVLFASALVAILVLSLVGGWWLAFGRYKPAPSLLTLSKDQAIAAAQQAGLKIHLEAGIYREDVAKDIVLKQEPAPGDRIAKGGTLNLTLSLGPERYQVPNVVGKSLELATADLQADPLKFQVQQGPTEYSDTQPQGIVVRTDPAVGTELKPGSSVTVILSKGRSPLQMPVVIGLQIGEAEQQLTDLGFKVTKEAVLDTTYPFEQVIDQDPPAGTGMVKGQEVHLKYSGNQSMKGMPNVMNMGCNDAKNNLEAAGYQVDVNGGPIDKSVGHVTAQNPAAGKPVQPGQLVHITCRWP
jgi:serine/threonine-protein kinase